MKEKKILLVTGGSRSGKSRFARARGDVYGRKVFLATAVATDPEMEERIAQHRQERGAEFLTVEEPVHLAAAIQAHAASADLILVDCLTFWLNNLFHRFDGVSETPSGPISGEIKELLAVLREKATSLILVTNEINMGVVPADPLSRRFVEAQGRLNQSVAEIADEVVFMVSGIPQFLKEESFYAKCD